MELKSWTERLDALLAKHQKALHGSGWYTPQGTHYAFKYSTMPGIWNGEAWDAFYAELGKNGLMVDHKYAEDNFDWMFEWDVSTIYIRPLCDLDVNDGTFV